MIRDFIRLLSEIDAFAAAVGLVIGLGIIAFLRGTQVWRHRSNFGYNTYAADRFRHRMQRLAVAAIVVGALGAIAYVLLWNGEAPTVFDDLAQGEPTIDTSADPLIVVSEMSLLIPRLAVETEVTHAPIVGNEWDISRLRDEVAHLAGTVYPGEPGNSVLAGHVTVPGSGWGPFRELEQLQPGDEIFVERGTGIYTYVVAEKSVVDPTNVEVAYPTNDDRLTLITCSDWDEEEETYAKRIVVIGYKIPDTDEFSASILTQ